MSGYERDPRPSRAYAIVFDRINPEQREQIHALVKEHADGWWHHFLNVWLVVGPREANEWRDLLQDTIPSGPQALLVLRLDVAAGDTWSWYGSNVDVKTRWLHQNLRGE